MALYKFDLSDIIYPLHTAGTTRWDPHGSRAEAGGTFDVQKGRVAVPEANMGS